MSPRALAFICLIALTYTDTHICDGNTLICTGGTVHCLDNEPCLVQCTGANDCANTNIRCPLHSMCTIECHTSAGRKGCNVASINATHSSSLLIDNQDVDNGFQDAPIYCPLFGNCSIIGSGTGRAAYKNIKVFAPFGFVFHSVSLTCQGTNCQTGAVMHCGNGYNSSCLFASDGMSCSNGPDTCDTIFRSISGTWTDDYSINPAPGWMVTDYNNDFIHSVYTGSLATYHGPFHGNTIQDSIETHSLIQYFYCAYAASAYVEYFYGFACQEDVDYSRLYLNDQLMADKHAKVGTGSGFKDDSLEALVHSNCPDAWHGKWLNGTLHNVLADTWFKVQIDVALNYVLEASVISSVKVTCVPPTVGPSISPVTSSPVTAVSVPSVSPTRVPSVTPTVAPSDQPFAAPTQPSSPTTAMPTASPVTVAPTMNTATPSRDPSNDPTEAPVPETANTGESLELWPSVKLQTSSTENVDFEGLIVALVIIGGFFVVTVVCVCKLWIQHETAYRPFYYKRQQMIQEMMTVSQGQGEMQEEEIDSGGSGDVETNETRTTMVEHHDA